ncbi:hypothetical protein HMPREF3038_01260 [Akkermansia sp. KLE1797]|nr:hypothetical protein HMPREF3038_01260 [Akkermansia sp. KLE1797]
MRLPQGGTWALFIYPLFFVVCSPIRQERMKGMMSPCRVPACAFAERGVKWTV